MKIVLVVARIFLGLFLLANGLNFWFHWLPITPPDSETATRLMDGLVFSGLFGVVKYVEVITGLMRSDRGVVASDLYPYYQDVYDHMLRVIESTDALRELVSTIVETNLSLRDYRQNLIMKKVTSWAAIIAVPTLVSGYYGMNVRFPGFASYWGAALSAALMLICSLTLYAIFKRRDWL